MQELANKEMEQAITGALITYPENFRIAEETLSSSDFYYEQNRLIFDALQSLFRSGKGIDRLILINALSLRKIMKDGIEKSFLEAVGNEKYIDFLISKANAEKIEDYAKVVRELSARRKLKAEAIRIIEEAASENSIEDIYSEIETRLVSLAPPSLKDISSFDEVSEDLYDLICRRMENPNSYLGIETPFKALNEITSGLQAGELIVLAARPGAGKTAMAMNIAAYAAVKKDIPVAFFSLEMSSSQLLLRTVCGEAFIDNHKVKRGQINTDELLSIRNALNKYAASPIFVDDNALLSCGEMTARLHKLKEKKGLGLVIIDYIQLMKSGGKGGNRVQEISEITRNLKIMAKTLQVPILALSQLSRAVEERSDKRPVLSDLRDSGSIEQDADIVMFIYRDAYYNKPDVEINNEIETAELIIAKHRNGATGKILLAFNPVLTKFENLYHDGQNEPEILG